VENVEKAMQAVLVLDNQGEPTGVYKYEGGVANRALELIGKEFGMFVDRKEIGGAGAFDHLDDVGGGSAMRQSAGHRPHPVGPGAVTRTWNGSEVSGPDGTISRPVITSSIPLNSAR
jgi:hypothetical protein